MERMGNEASTLMASVAFAVLVYIASVLTGCADSVGWRFSVGLTPVKQIDERQQLTQEPKRTPRKEDY